MYSRVSTQRKSRFPIRWSLFKNMLLVTLVPLALIEELALFLMMLENQHEVQENEHDER